MTKSFLFCILLLSGFTFRAYSQESNYFYSGKNYGSEATFSPVSLLLNGSYDIIQLENNSRDPFSYPYSSAWTNVWRNISNPFHSIRVYGVKNFFRDEVIPFDLSRKNAQWWPNYQLHLVGGGMTYVAIKEWYQLHNYPQPKLFALATTAAYQFLNETIENNTYQGITVDPISDIYIFNTGGILLFSDTSVCRFFSETLNLRDWSLQPTISFNDHHLHNNGQYFSIKWFTPLSEQFGVFYYFGMNGLNGVSYRYDDSYTISGGFGLRAKKLLLLDEQTNKKTVEMVWNTGFFIDKNNSLLASIFFSGLSDYTALINIYPGLINIGGLDLGCWTALSRDYKIAMGINFSRLRGIGYSMFR